MQNARSWCGISVFLKRVLRFKPGSNSWDFEQKRLSKFFRTTATQLTEQCSPLLRKLRQRERKYSKSVEHISWTGFQVTSFPLPPSQCKSALKFFQLSPVLHSCYHYHVFTESNPIFHLHSVFFYPINMMSFQPRGWNLSFHRWQ